MVGPAESADSAREDRELREEQLRLAQELNRAYPAGDSVFILAAVCNEQGNVESAIRYWEEGIRLPPAAVRLHDRAEALANLAEALKVKEDFPQAEARLRESLRLNPRRGETRFRLAQLLYERDRWEECLAMLDEGRLGSGKALALRGQACQRLGRLEEARHHFEATVKLDPSSAETLYGLSVTCARLGDNKAAAEYRQRFAALKSEQQAAGRGLRAQFNPLRTTRQSLALTHTTIGWVYSDHGELAKAEAVWRRAAEVDPANTACRFHLLMLYQRAGRNREALQACEEMIRAEPTNAFHRIGLGNLYTRLGQTADAGAAFQKAFELAPRRPETCFALAQFYLRTNRELAEAVKLAQQAVELAPAAPHYYMLSRAQARAGDRSAALAAIARACELEPANREYQAWQSALMAAK